MRTSARISALILGSVTVARFILGCAGDAGKEAAHPTTKIEAKAGEQTLSLPICETADDVILENDALRIVVRKLPPAICGLVDKASGMEFIDPSKEAAALWRMGGWPYPVYQHGMDIVCGVMPTYAPWRHGPGVEKASPAPLSIMRVGAQLVQTPARDLAEDARDDRVGALRGLLAETVQ